MRGLVGLTCLCWLLASVGQTLQDFPFGSGNTYTYEVESLVVSGIPDQANQYSGFELLYDLHMDVSPNKLVCWISAVRLGKLNDEVPGSYVDEIEIQHTPSPHYERELSKPFIVYFDEHQVVKLEVAKSDPTWSVNMKKSIAEKFQVHLKPSGWHPDRSNPNHVPRIDPTSPVFTTYESGIGGECETRYTFLSVPSLDHPYQSEDVLNVTKVKSYRNCRNRVIIESDNFESQGCSTPCEPRFVPELPRRSPIWRESSSVYESGCHFGFEPDHHPVKSYSIVSYNVSGVSHSPLIEGIYARGKTDYNLYGSPIQVFAELELNLVKTRVVRSEVPKLTNPVVYNSLEYEFPEEEYLDNDDSKWYAVLGPVHIPELQQSLLRMLEDLVNSVIPTEPETSKTAGGNVVQIVNALTLFKRPELESIYQELESDRIHKVPRKQELMRKLFLDLLAIAASDECALFIHDLITSKRLTVHECVEVVQGIGKNTDEPSDEVIRAYIELLELPRVQQSRRLVSSVGTTIGKMVQDSCVEEDTPKAPQQYRQQPREHVRHPRALRNEDTSEETHRIPKPKPQENGNECLPEQLKNYIELIVQKLRNAKTFNKILVYVETLAHMGTPDVLPYITPYVTGEAPNADALEDEDTDFLATAAVYSLHHISEDYPDYVLPIVAPIYFDPSEDYDQRIAAFSVLMSCDPPLNLLERIAVELHNEINNQVGSYVYSLLSDIANSSVPCDRKMAQKCQLVLPHAPDFDIGIQYSNTYEYSLYDDDDDYGVVADFEYVASNVSNYPRSIRASLDFIQSSFIDNYLEIGGSMKGIDELLNNLLQPSGILTQILSRFGSNVQVRNIPQIIDIVKNRLLFSNQDVDIPRVIFYYKFFGRTSYLTLDEQYIVEILESLVEYIRQIDTSVGYSANYVKVWMPSTFVRVVPSIVGLPVVVSHRRPIILTFSIGNTRVSGSSGKQTPLNSAFAVSADVDFSVHMDSIAMAYVVDPVNDQIHGAAFEKTSEFAFAHTVEVVLDLQKSAYALSLKPKMPHEIFYHNSRPITFVGEATPIRNPKEEWLGDVNEIETIPEPFKFDERKEARSLGVSVRVAGDSESPWADIPLWLTDTADDDGVFAAFVEMVINPEMINRELHVYLEPHRRNPASEVVFTIDYDTFLKVGLPKTEDENEESSSEEEEYEKTVSSIYGRSYTVPDAESTIEKLVKKTQATWAPILGQGYSDPVPATVSHVLDLTMAIKGQRTRRHALRLVYAHSLGFRSNWFQALVHSSNVEHENPWQMCVSLVAAYPEPQNPFYVEMNTLKSHRAKFDGEIGWGTDCQRQSQIRIEGVMRKSEQQLTTSSGIYESEKDQQSLPWYYKQCQVDKTEGKTQSYACQQAINDDSLFYVVQANISTENVLPEPLLNLTHHVDLLLKYLLYPNMEVNPFVYYPERQVSVKLHYSVQVPENPLIDLEIIKPTERIIFRKLYFPLYEPPSTLDSYEETFMDQFFNDDYYPECNLMEDYLSTFDNVTIELPDNDCQYILAHDSSPDKSFTVIASQIDFKAKTKALSMVLAGHTIKVLPPRGELVPIVLDGKEQNVSPRRPIVLDFDKETELRIYSRLTSVPTETPILVIRAEDDDITVKYDGKNALIKLPREYQGDQVGLCGDFNDEEFQEFTGPHGCVYLLEEDFAHSYVIPGQNCPKPPRPHGPAFCPVGVQIPGVTTHVDENEIEEKERPHPEPLPVDEDNEDETVSNPRIKIRPEIDEVPSHVIPTPKRLPHHRDVHPQTFDEVTETIGKPEGPSRCIREYTHSFEDEEGKTCFATQPVYRCRPGCKPIRPTEVTVPYNCMPPSKYEKILKEQARHGLVSAVQNKHVDKTRPILIPEKCL